MLTLLFTILLTLTQSGKNVRRLLGKNVQHLERRRLLGKNFAIERRRLLGKSINDLRRLLGKNVQEPVVRRLLGKNKDDYRRRLLGKNQGVRRLLGKSLGVGRRLLGKHFNPRRLLGKDFPVRRLLGKNTGDDQRQLLGKIDGRRLLGKVNRRLLQNPAVPLPTATEAAGAQGATEMECLLSNKDPSGCAGRMTNIMNPPQNFKLKCGAIGSCASSTFNFGYTNMVERIEMILMAAPWAGYGATIIIDSRGNTIGQSIDVLECAEIGACQDLVIKLYGSATINDIKCSQVDFCQGCIIKECHDNPAGIEVCVPTPCWGY